MGRGQFTGVSKFLANPDHLQLTMEAISKEALTTSEIEGELLDRASVQSSIRKQFGLVTDRRRVKPAEQGVAEMMVDLYRNFATPLTEEMLFGWHRILMQGRDLKEIGQYRSGVEPMQIISRAGISSVRGPRVHFEAPPSGRVAGEMTRFVEWFNATSGKLPSLTRAGIAHLYFESIHPFEDGNGRIGRAISSKALAQGAGEPTLMALSATLLVRRKAYYSQLEAASKSNNLTTWLKWFAAIGLEAQQRTEAQVEFMIGKTRLLDRLQGDLNQRQLKALLRMLREGPDGFEGGLSAGNYATITGASPATTTRDLVELVEKGALVRTGERRHARYSIAIPLRYVGPVRIDKLL